MGVPFCFILRRTYSKLLISAYIYGLIFIQSRSNFCLILFKCTSKYNRKETFVFLVVSYRKCEIGLFEVWSLPNGLSVD